MTLVKNFKQITPVPEYNFKSQRLRFLFDAKSGATPSSRVAGYWGGEIYWVTPEDLGKLTGREVTGTKRKITKEGYQNSGASIAPVGSLVLSKRAPIGQTAILAVESSCNQGCFLLTANKELDTRFYYYTLLYLRPYLEIFGRGSTFMELSSDDLRSVILPCISFSEQKKIADYLDRETTQIDSLIAEKKKMLDLLEEKRAALISQAVTRGLNPDVEFVPSGLDWLGDIPKGWDVIKLGYLVSLQGGATPATNKQEYWEGNIPWASPKDIKKPILTDTIDHISELAVEETNLSLMQPSALLLVVRGMILAKCIPTTLTAVPVTINQDMKAIYTLKSKLLPQYLKLCFDGLQNILSTLIEESAHGTKKLRTDLLNDFKLPLPSLEEQQSLISMVVEQEREHVAIYASLTDSIKLLEERRTALITAAVTGKLDLEEMTA